jgi:hypothetical protein
VQESVLGAALGRAACLSYQRTTIVRHQVHHHAGSVEQMLESSYSLSHDLGSLSVTETIDIAEDYSQLVLKRDTPHDARQAVLDLLVYVAELLNRIVVRWRCLIRDIGRCFVIFINYFRATV